MTVAVLLMTPSLILRPGPATLRFIFMGLLLAPILWGWWLLWRSRRGAGLAMPLFSVFYLAFLIVPQAVQATAHLTLDLLAGRHPSPFDGVALVLALVALLILVLRNRGQPL
ncbi:hypothetical protein Dalu01_01623 [Deinococcus aluminii]|uniref:Uncharacterized protein n=2 Tax=Deinococcus aluminii TaxID=1656885 RepID=A0ABP9XCZ9_9DEIO